MNNNESMEMYLESVYILERDHGHAHSAEIAKRLKVSKPSVTKAMNYLRTKGLIIKENYGPITLTDEGRKISENIYHRHQLISTFLIKSLGLSADIAVENACRIEHVISEEMVIAIDEYLKN